MSWLIRRADAADGEGVAAVYLAARHANAATIPPLAHSDAEIRGWASAVLLTEREVWLVETGEQIVGVLALDEEWVDQLYVHPEHAGHGIGTALLDLAKALRPAGFGLWTFVSNTGAQRFYERHGLVEVERTDGASNEERSPDIHYAWWP